MAMWQCHGQLWTAKAVKCSPRRPRLPGSTLLLLNGYRMRLVSHMWSTVTFSWTTNQLEICCWSVAIGWCIEIGKTAAIGKPSPSYTLHVCHLYQDWSEKKQTNIYIYICLTGKNLCFLYLVYIHIYIYLSIYLNLLHYNYIIIIL